MGKPLFLIPPGLLTDCKDSARRIPTEPLTPCFPYMDHQAHRFFAHVGK
jgi:hypothetical protein